jgi:hypothetical protein
MANVALYEWFNGLFLVPFLADGTPQCFIVNVDVTGNLQHNISLMIDFTCQKAEDSVLNLLKTHYLPES